MESQQAFNYITEHREDLLNFIERKGLSFHDAEDLLSEATCDVIKYYNTDMAKSVHLAIERQIGMYFSNRGNVANRTPQEIKYMEDSFEDMLEMSSDDHKDPLDKLIEEEIKSDYPDLISSFATTQKSNEVLHLIYIDNLSVELAADIAGISRSHAFSVNAKFLEYVGAE